MRQWLGITDTPAEWTDAVVTVGAYDGVHRGHQRTIAAAVELARRLGRPAVVATYAEHDEAATDPDGGRLVASDPAPRVLTGPRHKAELIEAFGVDGLCVLPAAEQPGRMGPDAFARDVLAGGLRASAVVTGAEFRFGRDGAGDLDGLRGIGTGLGFDVHAVPMLDGSGGAVVSSALIRALVAAGDVAAAAADLGRDHRIEGTVVRGADRGASELGFPTANVDSPGLPAVPGDGVYAGHLVVRGEPLPAAISVGTNPTFDGVDRTVEAYVLDFSGDLYGERDGVDFRARLRGQVRFTSVPALIEQMNADVDEVRRVLGRVGAGERDA